MSLNDFITQNFGEVATEKHHVKIDEVNFDNFDHSGDLIDFVIGENAYVVKCDIFNNSDDFQKWVEIEIKESHIIISVSEDCHYMASPIEFDGIVKTSIEEQLVALLREHSEKNHDWL